MRDKLFQRKLSLAGILDAICRELELSPEQMKRAKEEYEEVGRWLEGGSVIRFYLPRIFPQGSMALGTPVKPWKRAEFDVDLVALLQRGQRELGQAYVKQLIGDRLSENQRYRKMLEDLNRGWRLNHLGQFHLDIAPTIPNPDCPNGGLLVPDKRLSRWKPTNPAGYVRWFLAIAEMAVRLSRTFLFEGRHVATVEPLPEQKFTKSVLQRAVQIVKRHRDIAFEGEENAPISVILTTLVARAYEELVRTHEFETEFDLLLEVLRAMPRFIEQKVVAGRVVYVIPNPTTTGENFAEKWNQHPERAAAFYRWHERAVRDLGELEHEEGLDAVGKTLGLRLGAAESSRVVEQQMRRLHEARQHSALRFSPAVGLGTSAGLSVPRNTFFGAGT